LVSWITRQRSSSGGNGIPRCGTDGHPDTADVEASSCGASLVLPGVGKWRLGYSDEVPPLPSAADSPDDSAPVRSRAGGADGRSSADTRPLRGPHHTRSSHLLHRLGDWSSKAVAGVTVSCLLAGWAVVGIVTGFPSWWQVALYSTTSAVTVVMVFAIQHTQRREQLVTQRKLDELVQSQPGADDRMVAAEAATDAQLDDLMEVNDP
jgi:low affinity Fe/Cu permease